MEKMSEEEAALFLLLIEKMENLEKEILLLEKSLNDNYIITEKNTGLNIYASSYRKIKNKMREFFLKDRSK
jgi:hypothetical protein